MASFSAGTTFTDGVANDVTAAKLGALVNNATPTSGLIQDRTAETITATNDTLLIGDASDSNNLKRITVANFAQTLPTARVTTGTISTATLGTTTGTAATFTTLTAGTTTSTAATITSGTIPTLTAGTTTGTAASFSGDLTIADKIVHSGDTNTAIRFPAADTVTVETSGAERVRVDSSGNVGIGVTPSAWSSSFVGLQIGGTTSIFTDKTNVFRTFIGTNEYFDGTNRKYLGNGAASEYLQATDGSHVWYGAGAGTAGNNITMSERLRIDSSGNVGIGTATSLVRLTVDSGSAAQYGRFNSTAANGGYLTIESSGIVHGDIGTAAQVVSGGSASDFGINARGSRNLVLGTNNTERLRIDSSGNVGIGTTSPTIISSNSKILDIVGDASGAVRFERTNSTNPAYGYVGAINGAIDLRAQSNTPLLLSTNNTERLRIDSDGDVSIGTATALSKLHVHGNITLSNTTTATSAGTSTITPPATVAGYLTVSINGTSRKIAYYAT